MSNSKQPDTTSKKLKQFIESIEIEELKLIEGQMAVLNSTQTSWALKAVGKYATGWPKNDLERLASVISWMAKQGFTDEYEAAMFTDFPNKLKVSEQYLERMEKAGLLEISFESEFPFTAYYLSRNGRRFNNTI